MNVVIVGVGALGSHALLFARNVEATWTIIDFDRVEHKNTMSQFHTRMGLRQNKATALSKTMMGLFSMKPKAIPHELTADNVEALLGSADLVVDCLDNAKARKVIQSFVRDAGIACIHGALAPNGEFGRVVWDDHFVIDDEAGMGGATCEDGEHLPFIVQVSALIAEAIKNYVSNGVMNNYQISPGGSTRL